MPQEVTFAKKSAIRSISYVVNKIEELREIHPADARIFKTHAGYLSASRFTRSEFNALLSKLQSEAGLSFKEVEIGINWGSHSMTIVLEDPNKFDHFSQRIQSQLKSIEEEGVTSAYKPQTQSKIQDEKNDQILKNPAVIAAIIGGICVLLAAIITSPFWGPVAEKLLTKDSQQVSEPSASPTSLLSPEPSVSATNSALPS